jgi:hypothetical protein
MANHHPRTRQEAYNRANARMNGLLAQKALAEGLTRSSDRERYWWYHTTMVSAIVRDCLRDVKRVKAR